MKITVLTGGVGGAKFLLGVKAFLGWKPTGPGPDDGGRTGDGHGHESGDGHGHEPGDGHGQDDGPADMLTAIVNTADDIRLHNLRICPDLDSCLYTTSGAVDPDRGWGRADETWSVAAELAEYGAEAPWFSLGDKDIATHLMRTRMLDAGYPLSAVTEAIATRWRPGVRLLPMSDDRVETHVVVADPDAPADGDEDPPLVALHFQEWWIRFHAALPALSITPIGAEKAAPAPGVIAAIAEADVVLVAPSNPVVSIDTVLAVPGIRQALADTAAPVVGVSPVIGGRPVRGHADACLAAIGVECTAQGVAAHYGARPAGGLLDAFLVAEGDRCSVPGLSVGAAPLMMRDADATARIVTAALELVDVRR